MNFFHKNANFDNSQKNLIENIIQKFGSAVFLQGRLGKA